MQVLDDILTSMKGSAKTRVRDPIIGTFIVSWSFCNWDKLAVLLWGNGEAEQRITALGKSMAVIEEPGLLVTDLDLIVIPTALTFIYLFVLPVISLWVKKKQDKTILSQHSHAIELDIKRAEEQKNLNKAALRANPEKEFLAEEVKLDLQREKERLERRSKIKGYIEKKAEAAKAEAELKSTQAEKEHLDFVGKKRKEEVEKRRFDEQTAVHKATMASARFPVVYQMMDSLSASLRQDSIVMTLDGLSNSIGALFGYADSKEMMDDEQFNNENLNNVKYIYHQPSLLTKRLEEIIANEESDNEDLSEDMLYDHLTGVLENYPIEFLSDESLAESISESINENSYDILSSDELSGAMAETDTIFEEIELGLDGFTFNPDVGFNVKLSGYASGHHRREVDISGRDLSVYVTALCEPVVGRYGLSSYKLEIGGSPRDYGSD